MKIISIADDLQINDLGDVNEVNKVINEMDLGSDNNLELNLRHCFIDYPLTSKIIDRILIKLKSLKGKKELVIRHDYYLPEPMLLNLLFFGSEFFGILSDAELSLDELKSLLNSKLGKESIAIEILIVDRKGEIVEKNQYGG